MKIATLALLATISLTPGIAQTTIEIIDGQDTIAATLNDPLSDALDVDSYHCFLVEFPDGSMAYDFDLDEDGVVGSSDLLIFVGYYGETFISDDLPAFLSQYGSSPDIDSPDLNFFDLFGIFSSGTLVYVPVELEPYLFDFREVVLPYSSDDGIIQYTAYDEPGPFFFDCPDPYELCPVTWRMILFVEYETGIEAEFYHYIKTAP